MSTGTVLTSTAVPTKHSLSHRWKLPTAHRIPERCLLQFPTLKCLKSATASYFVALGHPHGHVQKKRHFRDLYVLCMPFMPHIHIIQTPLRSVVSHTIKHATLLVLRATYLYMYIHIRMYLCTYTFVYIQHIYTCLYFVCTHCVCFLTNVYMCVYVYIYICLYVFMYLWIYIFVCFVHLDIVIFIYLCIVLSLHLCPYVYIYVYVYAHIYLSISIQLFISI